MHSCKSDTLLIRASMCARVFPTVQPEGGFCPGGSRVWPLPGYWSGVQMRPSQGELLRLLSASLCSCEPPLPLSLCLALFPCRSYNEYLSPIRCLVSEACPGLNRSVANANGFQQANANTQQCSEQYT